MGDGPAVELLRPAKVEVGGGLDESEKNTVGRARAHLRRHCGRAPVDEAALPRPQRLPRPRANVRGRDRDPAAELLRPVKVEVGEGG